MINIQDKQLSIPIIQGGMGVGVSLSSLAGHVAKNGGMGVISAAHPGYNYPTFRENSLETNCQAIKDHIQKAKEISQGNGLVGVNIMVASQNYDCLVKAAIEGECDAIISGAGLPLDLPKYKNNKTLLAPIVSSQRAASIILKIWDRKYQYIPDFIVIEGSEAGGHLGFKKEDLLNNECQPLDEILKEVLEVIQPYQQKYQKEIPVFVAGGIDNGQKAKEYINQGATGIQIATPFIVTKECDASYEFKQAIIDCKKEDIEIIKSPTGYPGRAIVNDFIKKTRSRGNICMNHCLHCMAPCNPKDTPYCISEALIQTVKGNVNNGVVFVGKNAYKLNTITTVKEVIDSYMKEIKL
jgi:NAD(P)H-dependent flavin oxidoreductase YrpB (nitropropane dioxygenase family)